MQTTNENKIEELAKEIFLATLDTIHLETAPASLETGGQAVTKEVMESSAATAIKRSWHLAKAFYDLNPLNVPQVDSGAQPESPEKDNGDEQKGNAPKKRGITLKQ